MKFTRRLFLPLAASLVAPFGMKWVAAHSAFSANGRLSLEPKMEAPAYPWEKDTDSTIIANMAIGSLRDSVLNWLTGERGVHAETLMVTIGALAGFAAQNATLRSIEPPGTPIPKDALVMAETGGERYYFGDRLNGHLVWQTGQSPYPLWGYIAAAALQAGMAQKDMPDVNEMFGHVARTIGTPAFGIPRAPKEHPQHLTPRQALEAFWPATKQLLSNADGVLVRGKSGPLSGLEELVGKGVAEEHWPLVTALVARQFILMAKDTLAPRIALSLVMESAIAMSKVDPKKIPQTEAADQ